MRRSLRLKLDGAGLFVAGCWAAGLALDYVLLKKGKRPITDFCRDNPLSVGIPLVVLGLHVADVLGPLDPFKVLGNLTGVHPREVIEEIVQDGLESMVPVVRGSTDISSADNFAL